MQWTYDALLKSAFMIVDFLKYGKRNKLIYSRNSVGLLPSHYHFNNSERAFLSVLEKVVGSQFYVIGKIKAFDVLSFEIKTHSYARLAQKNFSNYYFDYVVCSVHTHQVVCVVELERSKRQTRMQRKWAIFLETLMQQYCSMSELPRLIVAEQRGYNLNELIERFEGVVEQIEVPSNQQSNDVFVL